MRCGLWVVTPVGHVLVLQRSAWMQPTANIMTLATLHMSAPNAILVTMSKPVAICPLAMSRILSRSLIPKRQLCTNTIASLSGVPKLLLNSRGAAPVPPSAPSTVMKSGVIPVANIALQIPMNSLRTPKHSLKPIGLPPDSCLN